MTTLPRITIITPSYNQADFLERTIRSVLDQRYPNLEYFVIDGGSTDDSVQIIKRYADRLAWWVSQPDRGQTDAINKGLSRATGQIIAYINSDDVYLPGTLDRIARIMAHGPDTPPWVVGRCLQIDTQDQQIGSFQTSMPASLASYLMLASGMLPQPSCFWASWLFKKHGHFDVSMHYSFDYEYHCRLIANGYQPRLIDQPLAGFRMHSQSKGCSQQLAFGVERITVGKRYAHAVPWRQRLDLWRNLGYRQRCYAIQIAQQQPDHPLWPQVLRRPWWLASDQVRRALSGSHQSMEEAA